MRIMPFWNCLLEHFTHTHSCNNRLSSTSLWSVFGKCSLWQQARFLAGSHILLLKLQLNKPYRCTTSTKTIWTICYFLYMTIFHPDFKSSLFVVTYYPWPWSEPVFCRRDAMCFPDPCPSCQCTLSYVVLRAVLRCLMLSDVLFVVSCSVLCCPMMLSCAGLYAHWWSVLAVLPSLWLFVTTWEF